MVAMPQPPSPTSEVDYLAFEDASPLKHEFSKGEILAMSGGSLRHNTICMNIGAGFHQQLAGRDCLVSTSDTRIKIETKVSYRYPDVTVICGQPQFLEGRTDTVLNPVLLVEVLSPATALVDLNDKLDEYLQIPALKHYLIVSQDVSKIQHYARQSDATWCYQQITHGVISLPDLALTLNLDDVYSKLDLTG